MRHHPIFAWQIFEPGMELGLINHCSFAEPPPLVLQITVAFKLEIIIGFFGIDCSGS